MSTIDPLQSGNERQTWITKYLKLYSNIWARVSLMKPSKNCSLLGKWNRKTKLEMRPILPYIPPENCIDSENLNIVTLYQY